MIQHLNNPNPRLRTAAIQFMSREPDVPDLLEALKHPVALVRAGAARVLGLAKVESAVPALIGRLNDGDAQVRMAAIDALGLLRDPQALDPLIACLNDPQARVVIRAAHALAKTANRQAVDPLIVTLQHPNLGVQTMVAFALGRIGDSRAAEPLLDAMRCYAMSLEADLHQWDVENNQRLLLSQNARYGLAHSNVLDQFAAALGELGEPALDLLIVATTDVNRYVRQYGAVALGAIQDDRSRDILRQLVEHDSEAEVRRTAAWALSQTML
ncbi:MAG: HEAT repeat domain-containing protein [Anaerolineales bacterium]|nr:HEAT repeat domain-containing protein [Anaerolineales bacterium]